MATEATSGPRGSEEEEEGTTPEAPSQQEPASDAPPQDETKAAPAPKTQTGASGLRARLAQVTARLRALDLVPSRMATLPLRKALPKDALGWVSAVLLWGVFLFYIYQWTVGNKELLFDPHYANDDSRTAHYPFHRYGPEHALADDPIANEMKQFWMPAMALLYRVLVPAVGIFWAPKVAQGLALGLLFAAGYVLVRARRVGLAGGILLVFLLLRDKFFVERLAGGFGRGFAMPCFALWFAGAVAASERVRYTAAIIAALTQNYAAAMLLGAEGIYAVADAFVRGRGLLKRRAKRYAVLVATCFVLVGSYAVTQMHGDHIHTIAEVERSDLFKNRHRGEYPFADPAPQFGARIVSSYMPGGKAPAGVSLGVVQQIRREFDKGATTFPLAIAALLLVAGFARFSPPARPALAFLSGTMIVYLAARLLAYRLYAPDRYYSYGAPLVGVMLAVMGLGLLGPRLRRRAAVRNFAVAGFMLGMWAFAGDGVAKLNGMTIHERPQAKLYDFVKTLPVDARIACHPWDGDDIPWWAARATTGGFETLQMWMVGGAARAEVRTKDVLRALYATSRQDVLAYAHKYRVSHFMLRKDRYESDFVQKSQFIEPFTTFTARMLASVKPESLVLGNIPESAIVYRQGPLQIVDVALLEKAWQASP
jgi:hypothetical protein